MKRYRVLLEKFAEKQRKRLPIHIRELLLVWTNEVEYSGLPHVRKIPGYHDEPLHGRLKGLRSVRLSRAYRVIYREDQSGETVIVAIQEINRHEY